MVERLPAAVVAEPQQDLLPKTYNLAERVRESQGVRLFFQVTKHGKVSGRWSGKRNPGSDE